jgi:hypothetical protein
MEVRVNNLFRNGKLFELDKGEVLLLREPILYQGGPQDLYHKLKDLESLDMLAYRYYSKFMEDASKLWWVIADANDILDPMDLSDYVGKNLLIPRIDTVMLNL